MTNYANNQVNFQAVSNVTATLGANDPEPGYRTTVGDEDYVFVYNAGNSQIPPTYGAVMSAVSGYSVTISSTTSVDFLVGVCKHATLTTGTYGWLVTKGFVQVEMEADNSAAAGQILALAADGEFALKSNSTGYPTPAVGKAMEAIASAGSGTAYISVN
jgi:hypothetical protein